MTINWSNLRNSTDKYGLERQARQILKANNYGFNKDQWNLTEIVQTTDSLKFLLYQIFDGEKLKDGTKLPPMSDNDGQPFRFKLKVLNRFACCRDKDGNKIWQWTQAKQEFGEENDILPDPFDEPKPGDVVEIKGTRKMYDEEHGRGVDFTVLKEWAVRRIRPENYVEYVVDQDLCISVQFPYVLSMLSKHGKNVAFPQFKKIVRRNRLGDIKDKDQLRRLTNWYFQEVPKDYQLKKTYNKKSTDDK